MQNPSLSFTRKLCNYKKFEKKLGVSKDVTEDGKYSIEFAECLADCGEGPVVMVGDQTFEKIQEERMKWQI